MFLVSEDVFLQGKKNTGTVYQVDDRQVIFHGDLLQAQILFPGDGKPGTGFDRCIVGYDHTSTSADGSDTTDGTTGWTATLFGIHIVTGECSDLKKGGVGVDQTLNTLAGREFIFLPLFFLCGDAAPELDLVQPLTQVAQQLAISILILIEGKIHGETSLSKIRERN